MPRHTPHPSAAFCASVVAEAIGACMVAFVVSWVIGTGHRASLSQEAGAWHAVAQGAGHPPANRDHAWPHGVSDTEIIRITNKSIAIKFF